MKKYTAMFILTSVILLAIPVSAITQDDIIRACKYVSQLAMSSFAMGSEGYSCQAISKAGIRSFLKNKGIDTDELDIDRIHEQLVSLCESGKLNRSKRKYKAIDPFFIGYQFRSRCLDYPELMILKVDTK